MLSWSIRMSNKRKGNEFKVHLIPVDERAGDYKVDGQKPG